MAGKVCGIDDVCAAIRHFLQAAAVQPEVASGTLNLTFTPDRELGPLLDCAGGRIQIYLRAVPEGYVEAVRELNQTAAADTQRALTADDLNKCNWTPEI